MNEDNPWKWFEDRVQTLGYVEAKLDHRYSQRQVRGWYHPQREYDFILVPEDARGGPDEDAVAELFPEVD